MHALKLPKTDSRLLHRIVQSASGIRVLMIAFLWTCSALPVFSQTWRVSGTIIDRNDRQPVIGAFVYLSDLKDTTQRVATTTDTNGKFSLNGLRKKSYRMTIQSINYTRYTRVITLTRPVTSLGTIDLVMESKVLNEVVIVGQGTAVQKGDTTIMTADAFKVNADADAEDLVKKMPGITVENGTVKARGEDVEQVLVDGKPFFGDDPLVALRNLPADVIDRVQVYNRLSDQAELTGFDDGESTRTINIVTRKNSRYTKFGKITAGTDFDNKYLVAGNLNIFSGPRRFTLSGMTNNINQQNFAMQDLMGTSGGGSRRGGWGGQLFGGASGISKNSSAGLNYQDNWGKKISASGSYFFNTTANTNITKSNTEYLLTEKGKFADDSSYSYSENFNHRINMRIEYTMDTMNSLIIVPRLSLQTNNSDEQSTGLITGGTVNSQTIASSIAHASGLNLGNYMTWRHKFKKPGRTLSIRSSFSYDRRNNEDTQLATVDLVPDNQYTDNGTDNFYINTNFNYTEPLSKSSQLQLNFNNRFTSSKNNKEIYELGITSDIEDRIDSLSNAYKNNYLVNRGGISYLFRKENIYLSAGIRYERADLHGNQTFPNQAKARRTFQNFLPNLMMNWKISEITNLRFFYRTSTDEPSISELQNAINNTDRLRLSTGNPNLKQEYAHRFISNLSYANPTSGFNAFVFLMEQYSTSVISNKTIYAEDDTLVQPMGINVTLLPGGQLTYPVNLDRSVRLNTMINLSYFLKPIKSNISFVIGGGYTQLPEGINDLINRQHSYNLTNSLIITSNISANIDFTVSYTSNYTYSHNSLKTSNNNEYWYQSASAKLNMVLPKGIVINSDIVGQHNKLLSEDYNEKYLVWNASIGKKFLKNQAAELRIGAYDILDQNRSFYHTVTASYARDTWINAYQRYFLFIFTYNLRANRGQGQQDTQDQQERDRHDRFPGGIRSGGGPPGGYH